MPQRQELIGLRSYPKGTSQRPKYGHFQTNSRDQQGPQTPFRRTPIPEGGPEGSRSRGGGDSVSVVSTSTSRKEEVDDFAYAKT